MDIWPPEEMMPMMPNRYGGRLGSDTNISLLRPALNRSISAHGVLKPVSSTAASAPICKIVPNGKDSRVNRLIENPGRRNESGRDRGPDRPSADRDGRSSSRSSAGSSAATRRCPDRGSAQE